MLSRSRRVIELCNKLFSIAVTMILTSRLRYGIFAIAIYCDTKKGLYLVPEAWLHA